MGGKTLSTNNIAGGKNSGGHDHKENSLSSASSPTFASIFGPGASLSLGGGGGGCRGHHSVLTNKYKLHSISEASFFLKHNEFILSGYRPPLTVKRCLLSLFELHNETVNVWSHVLAAISFIILLYQTLVAENLRREDKVVLSIYAINNFVCFFFSSVYHLFCCISPYASYRLVQLDFMGIALAICGSFVPGIYYGFRCLPFARQIYLSLILGGTFILIGLHCIPTFNSDSFKPVRVTCFVLLAGFGVIPLFHWFSVSSEKEVQFFLPRILLMYVFYGVGLFFYLSKIPERLKAGLFDIWLHSHQLWHMFVYFGSLWFFYCCWLYCEFSLLLENRCPL